jgi:Peptidase inhibitor family I36
MRRSSTISVLLGLIMMTGMNAWAQRWGRPAEPSSGACFYEDTHFRGEYFCTRADSDLSRVPYGANDHISSIRLFGGARALVFADTNFRGASRRFDEDNRDLRRAGFNDRISSVRVEPGYGSGGNWGGGDWDGRWGRPRVPSSGVCFYQNPRFGGDYFCAPIGAAATQVPRGTNDKISSIRVYGNAEVTVFQDSHFEGRSSRFDRNMGDLRREGWNDLISSFRINNRGRGGNSGGGRSYDTDSRSGGRSGRASSRMTRQEAETMVDRAYRSMLGRAPDPGSRSWVDEVMKNDWTQQRLESELRNTPEYKSKHRR